MIDREDTTQVDITIEKLASEERRTQALSVEPTRVHPNYDTAAVLEFVRLPDDEEETTQQYEVP